MHFLNLAQNANKMPFPFNFTKILKDRHFTGTGSKILKLLPDTPFDTSFQNNVLMRLQLFHFVCYLIFLSYVQDMSSRYVFKTSSRRLQTVLEDVKLLRWKRVEDIFKTYLKDVLKTSSRPTNVCSVHTHWRKELL